MVQQGGHAPLTLEKRPPVGGTEATPTEVCGCGAWCCRDVDASAPLADLRPCLLEGSWPRAPWDTRERFEALPAAESSAACVTRPEGGRPDVGLRLRGGNMGRRVGRNEVYVVASV